jgi:hypothetical protein
MAALFGHAPQETPRQRELDYGGVLYFGRVPRLNPRFDPL